MLAGRIASGIGAIGIEIGPRAVRMLQLRRRGDGLHVVGAARFDAAGVGDEADASLLDESWKAALREGGFRGRRCIVGLPRADVRIETVHLPSMPEKELRQAAAWEAAHRFDLDLAHAQVDCIITGAAAHDGDDPLETVILVAATHEVLEARLRPLLAAGLRPLAVDTHVGGLAALFGDPETPGAATPVRAVVEIGATGASLLVLRGDHVAAHRPLSLCGADLDAAVAERIQVGMKTAGKRRRARLADGTAPDPAPDAAADRAIYEAVRPRLMDLVREVARHIDELGAALPDAAPQSIILTGDEGGEPMLDRLLAEACRLPVHPDDGAGTLAALHPQIAGSLRGAAGPVTGWAVAAGLGLRPVLVRSHAAPAAGRAVA